MSLSMICADCYCIFLEQDIHLIWRRPCCVARLSYFHMPVHMNSQNFGITYFSMMINLFSQVSFQLGGANKNSRSKRRGWWQEIGGESQSLGFFEWVSLVQHDLSGFFLSFYLCAILQLVMIESFFPRVINAIHHEQQLPVPMTCTCSRTSWSCSVESSPLSFLEMNGRFLKLLFG